MLEQALLSCGAGGRAPCPRSCLLSAIVRHIKAGRGLPIFVAVGSGGVVDGHIVDGPLPELLHGLPSRGHDRHHDHARHVVPTPQGQGHRLHCQWLWSGLNRSERLQLCQQTKK